MMSIFTTPYPRADFKTFLKVISIVSFSIIFVLVVFQPFGTAAFRHPFKYLILSGYGIITFIVSFLVFFLTNVLFPKKVKHPCTVFYEVLSLLCWVFASLISCYIYMVMVFDYNFRWNQFTAFILNSAAVALLPVSAYLFFINQKYKSVKRADLKVTENATRNSSIELIGNNKNEHIKSSIENILFAKSSDNYVILHLIDEGSVKKRMLRCTLSEIENQLGEGFIKVHRSYIINKQKLTDISGNITNSKAHLKGISQLIPVSRSNVITIRQLLQKTD